MHLTYTRGLIRFSNCAGLSLLDRTMKTVKYEDEILGPEVIISHNNIQCTIDAFSFGKNQDLPTRENDRK